MEHVDALPDRGRLEPVSAMVEIAVAMSSTVRSSTGIVPISGSSCRSESPWMREVLAPDSRGCAPTRPAASPSRPSDAERDAIQREGGRAGGRGDAGRHNRNQQRYRPDPRGGRSPAREPAVRSRARRSPLRCRMSRMSSSRPLDCRSSPIRRAARLAAALCVAPARAGHRGRAGDARRAGDRQRRLRQPRPAARTRSTTPPTSPTRSARSASR